MCPLNQPVPTPPITRFLGNNSQTNRIICPKSLEKDCDLCTLCYCFLRLLGNSSVNFLPKRDNGRLDHEPKILFTVFNCSFTVRKWRTNAIHLIVIPELRTIYIFRNNNTHRKILFAIFSSL